MTLPLKLEKCYWCGGDHDAKDCPMAEQEKLRKCYNAIADRLIEGDYIGTLRGEVNICLNVINYHKAFEEAAQKILPREKVREIQDLAYKIRSERYGRILW